MSKVKNTALVGVGVLIGAGATLVLTARYRSELVDMADRILEKAEALRDTGTK